MGYLVFRSRRIIIKVYVNLLDVAYLGMPYNFGACAFYLHQSHKEKFTLPLLMIALPDFLNFPWSVSKH